MSIITKPSFIKRAVPHFLRNEISQRVQLMKRAKRTVFGPKRRLNTSISKEEKLERFYLRIPSLKKPIDKKINFNISEINYDHPKWTPGFASFVLSKLLIKAHKWILPPALLISVMNPNIFIKLSAYSLFCMVCVGLHYTLKGATRFFQVISLMHRIRPLLSKKSNAFRAAFQTLYNPSFANFLMHLRAGYLIQEEISNQVKGGEIPSQEESEFLHIFRNCEDWLAIQVGEKKDINYVDAREMGGLLRRHMGLVVKEIDKTFPPLPPKGFLEED